MSKRLATTPRSRIKNTLRQLWLRSRERAAALKRDNYTCRTCNRKQSKAKGREFKVEVHHVEGIDWDGIVDLIIGRVLQTTDKLETQCKECHDALERTERNRQ